jgi:hypothetical protein
MPVVVHPSTVTGVPMKNQISSLAVYNLRQTRGSEKRIDFEGCRNRGIMHQDDCAFLSAAEP